MVFVITGLRFGLTAANGSVTMNGVPVPLASVATPWTDTQITVRVPPGGVSGPVVVTVLQSASNPVAFKVEGFGCLP